MSAKPKANNSNKSRVVIGVMLALVLLGGVVSFLGSGGKAPRHDHRKENVVSIVLPPPPPPPPPKIEPPKPKDEPPPDKQEMVEQEPVKEDEQPPDNSPPEAPAGPDLGPGSVGGTGPSIGGGGGGTGKGGHRVGGSKFGWYAAKVQSSIKDALSRNSSTRSATMSLQVRIWPDSNGRIVRAQLVGSSGDPAVDQAIRNNVLTGLQLPQAPPSDMPTPIVLRINARKSI